MGSKKRAHSAGEQRRQNNDDRSSSSQEEEVYDHNRNLRLADEDAYVEKRQEQLVAALKLTSSDEDQRRVSPFLSLADSDCTACSSPSDCIEPADAGGGGAGLNPVEGRAKAQQSAARGGLSDSGSSSDSTQLLGGSSAGNSLSNGGQGHLEFGHSPGRVSFGRQQGNDARQSEAERNGQVLINMFDLKLGANNNEEQEKGEEEEEEEEESERLTGGRDEEKRLSLVARIGRRAAWLASFLGRTRAGKQLAPSSAPVAERARHSSLPLAASLSAPHCCPGGAPSGEDAPSRRHSSVSAAEAPPTTTVAGVGGTVTTVTRKKRKTAPLPRLVAKNGQVNLFFDNIDRRKYFRDLFVTMIDIKWRYNLAAAAFGFVLSWLFFASIWYIVLFVHDDLNHENDPNWSPCIVNVYSFAAALLFSIETQSTLGFGSRIISVECPGAIVIFCVQLIFGVVIECLIVGMVFAKLTRPTKRSQTIMYSKCATICLREDQLCLTFRVGDVRSKSHIIGATIRASLVSQKITREGEIIPFFHNQLSVTIDNSNSLLLIWPVTIVHVIDETSPFYTLSSQQLANFKFELITVLEGTVESTGQSIQVRSSYLPSEVEWGYRFEPIVSAHGFGRYAQTIIDYNKFNRIIKVDTPTCSARDYYAQQARRGG